MVCSWKNTLVLVKDLYILTLSQITAKHGKKKKGARKNIYTQTNLTQNSMHVLILTTYNNMDSSALKSTYLVLICPSKTHVKLSSHEIPSSCLFNKYHPVVYLTIGQAPCKYSRGKPSINIGQSEEKWTYYRWTIICIRTQYGSAFFFFFLNDAESNSCKSRERITCIQ